MAGVPREFNALWGRESIKYEASFAGDALIESSFPSSYPRPSRFWIMTVAAASSTRN